LLSLTEHFFNGLRGDRVRLRLVNAAASIYFHVESATSVLTIVAADRRDIQPLSAPRLFIGIAETHDVVLHVPDSGGVWGIRAAAQEGLGHSSNWPGDDDLTDLAR